MVASSYLAIQTGRILLTLTLVLAVEVAVASIVILADFSLLPSSTYYPWGRAIGETAGFMMVPAIILWFVSLFRRATTFLVASVLVGFGLAFLVYQGSAVDNPPSKATFDGLIVLLGSVAAIAVVALRMRGKWKPKHLGL